MNIEDNMTSNYWRLTESERDQFWRMLKAISEAYPDTVDAQSVSVSINLSDVDLVKRLMA